MTSTLNTVPRRTGRILDERLSTMGTNFPTGGMDRERSNVLPPFARRGGCALSGGVTQGSSNISSHHISPGLHVLPSSRGLRTLPWDLSTSTGLEASGSLNSCFSNESVRVFAGHYSPRPKESTGPIHGSEDVAGINWPWDVAAFNPLNPSFIIVAAGGRP